MPKVKVKRASTTIDMKAMCDVSFLLLTFFILTATARAPEPLPVDTPASVTQVKVPDTDLGLITVGDDGKVFFGVKDRNVRARMLELMSEKDRKSTRLNSSHVKISYAVFCLKKKKKI